MLKLIPTLQLKLHIQTQTPFYFLYAVTQIFFHYFELHIYEKNNKWWQKSAITRKTGEF